MAVSAGALYAFGPWSADTPDLASAARPLDPPVSVPGRTVSVLAAGDILAHPELWDQARRDGNGTMDFAPMMASAKETVSGADLALCHMETAVAPPGGPYIGFPKFSVPREVVQGIKSLGYDGCSTASNHSIDQGFEGVQRTLDALDAAGLGHTGSYRTAADAAKPKIYTAKGVKIAHLSYTKDFNGLKPPAGKAWVANQINVTKIRKDAAAARKAGAQIVIVSMHWGTEYEHEPDVDQQTWARAIAQIKDVDIVFGHHAHVVQPVEKIGNTWIIYGMGNQIARHAEPINSNRDGAMMKVTFGPSSVPGRWKVMALEAIPTFVDLNPNIRLVDLPRELAKPDLSAPQRKIYEAAVDRIDGNLLTHGASAAGLIVHGTGKSS
ncbi:poly-gamma-glutamate biosynthesis protein [Actinoplanes sp. SE50/110]|nr:poly-gamma-glutamate biosynthesis protein [Actinoplanes sp. SE50/110]